VASAAALFCVLVRASFTVAKSRLLFTVYVCRLELMRTALRDHDRDMISTVDLL
jgi:hypothetical protein